ncbi:HET-domain-containing protein, partial [Zopfia rhizophila CBS 207.26]
MKEVEKWLHDCSCNHLACSQVKDKDTPLDIFLIDVVNRQIVPKRSDCQYLALSYVWGGACTFHLTKPRLKELQEQGALLRHINAIPQVIRDAMRFTDQINVQYLWVDSLCIIQDDPIHRDPQITHMNVIYRHAFATIINISGQNAESRLPGVSLGSRSTLKPIKMRKGVELQAIAPSLDLAILSSTYESRAWTYQERMLSSRCLYFTDWQVYFQCRSSLRSEDNEPVQIAKRHLVNPILEFETRPQAAKDYFWLDFFRCYDSVVRNYTQRQLSDDEDKLRAFSGIASTLDESGGGTFHYGLPGAILDLALLWIPAGPMEHYCPRKYDEASCTDYLPTWSWAGWQGAI